MELAKSAYQAYGDSVAWKNFRGDPMPAWDELPEAIQGAWGAASKGVVAHWLSHDFRAGLLDEKMIEKTAGWMIKVGANQKRPPMQALAIAIQNFALTIAEKIGVEFSGVSPNDN